MLEDQSVEKILQSIKSRQLSIKELMEYYLNRIDKINPDWFYQFYLNSIPLTL